MKLVWMVDGFTDGSIPTALLTTVGSLDAGFLTAHVCSPQWYTYVCHPFIAIYFLPGHDTFVLIAPHTRQHPSLPNCSRFASWNSFRNEQSTFGQMKEPPQSLYLTRSNPFQTVLESRFQGLPSFVLLQMEPCPVLLMRKAVVPLISIGKLVTFWTGTWFQTFLVIFRWAPSTIFLLGWSGFELSSVEELVSGWNLWRLLIPFFLALMFLGLPLSDKEISSLFWPLSLFKMINNLKLSVRSGLGQILFSWDRILRDQYQCQGIHGLNTRKSYEFLQNGELKWSYMGTLSRTCFLSSWLFNNCFQ